MHVYFNAIVYLSSVVFFQIKQTFLHIRSSPSPQGPWSFVFTVVVHGVLILFLAPLTEIPLLPFKRFSLIFLKLWAHGAFSEPPPAKPQTPPTLCLSRPIGAHYRSQRLLQRSPHWLLFLGVSWRGGGGGGYGTWLPVFTHI